MHHVAVPLDEHQVLHLHRAELAHAADIVAAEIDQHDVLGDLFLIRAQIGLDGAVLRPHPRCVAASRRSAVLHRPPMHSHQQLRRRPHNMRHTSASSPAASSSPNRRKYI